MINNIRLLRNVGQFDNTTAVTLAFRPLTLIYAENGRGKTTLSAIFRSLATNQPEPILERHRLAAAQAPEVIVDCVGAAQPAIFRNGTWNRHLPNLAVFDDVFVNENVYSGLSVDADHRQNLHDLIIGVQGVALNQRLQGFVAQIEAHNTELRTRAAAIPFSAIGSTPIDDFCALGERPAIDAEILEAERALEAARQQAPVRDTQAFELLTLPTFDIDAIDQLLARDLQELDAAAAARIQEHLTQLPPNSEHWIADGLAKVVTSESGQPVCPFCAQDMTRSPVLGHYRAYFGEEYKNLKRSVEQFITAFRQSYSEQMPAAFERSLRTAADRRAFWAQFAEMPDINLDSSVLAQHWQRARELLVDALADKRASPLDRLALSGETRAEIRAYEARRTEALALNTSLAEANRRIGLVKEHAAAGNAAIRKADVDRLKTIKARHEPNVVSLCQAYMAEKAAKSGTEEQRNQAREALGQYRQNVFPAYRDAINEYLGRFNAGFRIGQIEAVNTRGGPSCNYILRINNVDVPVGADPGAGRPSFRNTLSAGDRNTLALALFFAALDSDPALADKVVVIDDPVSSLDDGRTLSTIQELRRLLPRVRQIVILSHSKTFLCQTWDRADPTTRTAIEVRRDGATSSTLGTWNIEADMVTEYDRRHEKLRTYLENGTNLSLRDIAIDIRPTLEHFCRVAYPAEYGPGELLGTFRARCITRERAGRPVMAAANVQEMCDLTDYGNLFHHDSNPNDYLNVVVRDAELRGYVQRTLAFCSK